MKKMIKNYTILLATFSFMAISGCKSKNKAEAAEFFKRANYHFQKKDYEKALNFYSEAIEKQPEFADAYNNRGVLYETKLELPMAVKDFERAVEIDPSFSQAKINLASAYSQLQKYTAADEIFNSLQSTFKDSINFNLALGRHNLRLNKPKEALNNLNLVIKKDSTSAQLYSDMGYAHFMLKSYDNAYISFEKALKIDSTEIIAINNMSNVLAQQNKWSEALLFSGKAYEKEKTELPIVNTHVLNLLENGLLDNANEILERINRIADDNPYLKRNNAVYLMKKGDYVSANKILQQIEKSNPEIEFIYYYLGQTYLKMNNKKMACQYFQKGAYLKDSRSKMALKAC